MIQKDVSLLCVVAWLCWTGGAAVVVVDILNPRAQLLGLVALLIGAGAVLHVRGFIINLERREREVFELGRDSAMGGGSVRPLH